MSALAEPYRGPRSYRVQDRALFHGRGGDLDALLALVLGQRLAALHAPSGAGKTSLLKASLVPALEARRQVVALCRPGAGEEPLAALRAAIINRLLPPPASELVALRRIAAALGTGADGLGLSLADAKRGYRALPLHDPAYVDLVEDVPLPGDSVLRVRGAPPEATPLVARFLYLAQGSVALATHLARIESAIGDERRFWTGVAAMTRGEEVTRVLERHTLGDLAEFFSAETLRRWYEQTVATLHGSEAALGEFLAHLTRQFSCREAPLELVLILDQFEELFTLFGEQNEVNRHSSTQLVDYRRRDALFEQLGGMLAMRRPGLDGMPTRLPVRVLVSLRDDYVARLDELESGVGTIEARARYHLTVLRPEDAADVIRSPARAFGYDYDDEVFEVVKTRLTEEGSKIEPGHIQIVCERLWREHGRALHEQAVASLRERAGAAGDGRRATLEPLARDHHVSLAQFEALGGIKGILDTHFRQFLDAFDERDRIEILDMLAPLITSRHTRNIVMREVVVERRFVDRGDRARLLNDLRQRNIVRIETHRNGDFVEISHEFLIAAIETETVRTRELVPIWRSLRRAFDNLELADRRGFRSVARALSPREIHAIYWFRERLDPVEKRQWLAEAVLRAIIADLADETELPAAAGTATANTYTRAQMFDYWRAEVDRHPAVIDPARLLASLPERAKEDHLLDHLELAVLDRAGIDRDLGNDERQLLLQSAIRNADSETAGNIVAGMVG